MLKWSNIRIGNEQLVSQDWVVMERLGGGRFLSWFVLSILVLCSPTSVFGDVLSENGCAQCHLGGPPAQSYLSVQLSLAEIAERYRPSYVNALLRRSPEGTRRRLDVSHQLPLSDGERAGVITALYTDAV